MIVAKLLFNSTILTKGARFMTIDISNFYLNSPLLCPELIKIKLSDIPEEIINEYNLHEKYTSAGHVYIVADKSMYGLPQAGIIANKLLEKHLNEHGYRQSKLLPGLWKHDTRPIQFTLVVDDFGVKYAGKENVVHIKKALEQHYQIKCD